MNRINLTFLDKKILSRLQRRGMTVNEAMQVISFEIYYLGYRERMLLRKAIDLVGEKKKKAIITQIHMNKRKNYLAELLAKENRYNMENCNYLFVV